MGQDLGAKGQTLLASLLNGQGLERQGQNISPTDDEIAKLAEMKLPLVLRDYEGHFQHASRFYDRLNLLRGWEVTLISALVVVLLTRSNISPYAGLPIYLIIFISAMVESMLEVTIKMMGEDGREIEKRFHTSDIKEFQKNIATWTFGNTRGRKRQGIRTRLQMYALYLRELMRPRILIWHGGLALATLIFLIWIH